MTILTKPPKYAYVKNMAIYQEISRHAHHIDIKHVDSNLTMNQFIAGVFNYQPSWMTALYRVRQVFVRFLGMHQNGIPRPLQLDPDTLDLVIGEKIAFFDIDDVRANEYLVVSAEESHLKAILMIIREPLETDISRYYAVTIVHYNNWAGPIYFNVIRPFHHIVVSKMIQSGASKH